MYLGNSLEVADPQVCGNPPDDATPIFISESGSSILGLSNEVYISSVAQEIFEKMGKN